MSGFPGFAPIAASTIASRVDAITFVLLALCGLVFALVVGLIFYFSIRYHSSRVVNRAQKETGRRALELAWTLIPFGLFLIVCGWGAVIYMEMHQAPEGATDITVVGKQWMWKFQHPDGYRELNELHVPVGTPIRLTMISQDVIHSLFVPAFRIKQDVLPGRYVHTWFQATRPGSYHLFCTQYCGTSHSRMTGQVIALSPERFSEWQATRLTGGTTQQMAPNALSRGRYLFNHRACFACHVLQVGRLAPELAGVYGTQVPLSDGTQVLADENYLRESILNPRAKIVRGYEPIMPSFEGQLSEEDVAALIAYLKSMKSMESGGTTQP